jgi:general secretion pathway protein H
MRHHAQAAAAQRTGDVERGAAESPGARPPKRDAVATMVTKQRGMTLLEILVVLAILGLVTAILVWGLGRAGKLELRADAGKLAAALRQGFDRAAATGAHHRVVLDLDRETFLLERCEGKVRLRRTTDEAKAAEQEEVAAQIVKLKAELEAAASAPLGGAGPGGVPGTAVDTPPPEATEAVGQAGCAPVAGKQGKPQALHKGHQIDLKRVFVSHLEKPAEEGKVTVNFFPLGRAEKAVLEVAQGAELFSLVVQPLTGRVQILVGEWKHPEEFVEEDATGEEQFE